MKKYKLETYPLNDYRDTVKKIYWLSNKYFKDLLLPNKFNKSIPLMSEKEFFEFIKSLPYVKDKEEFLNRPKISLELAGNGHYFDCDDRTILSLSFFKLKNHLLKRNKYDYQIVVTGRYDKPRHVFIEFKDNELTNSKWIPYDPTYPHNKYGEYLYNPGFIKKFKESDLKNIYTI
ncbi:MAG: hypothetical protein KDK36_12880 [Leptospiraceae bacterium]|nr:hypothetical protein [Leptospiraceae bacterium]